MDIPHFKETTTEFWDNTFQDNRDLAKAFKAFFAEEEIVIVENRNNREVRVGNGLVFKVDGDHVEITAYDFAGEIAFVESYTV